MFDGVMNNMEQFYEKLASPKIWFRWQLKDLDDHTVLRGSRYIPRMNLFNRIEFCPLTAAYYAETGQYVPIDQWKIASAYFGLTSREGAAIVRAADEHNDNNPVIRHRLIKMLLE